MVYTNINARMKHRRLKMRFGLFLLLLALAVMITITIFDLKLRPLVLTTAKNKARLYASEVISESVDEVLVSGVVDKNTELVNVVYDDSGVSSIETNVYAINRLRAASVKNIAAKLSDIAKMTLSVPLGNLVGNTLLTGRGLPVSIKLVPIGDVDAELYSEFLEAGINQTLHRIYIRVCVSMNMLVASDTVKLELSNDILLSETVIVGDVPSAYTSINRFEIDEDEENDINDYAATLP